MASPSADQARQQSGDERDAAEELESRYERGRDRRQRDAHLGERTGDAGQPELEQLLGAVGQEDRARHDAEEGEAGVEPCVSACHVGTLD